MCVADGDVIEGRFLSAMARQDDGRGLWDVALALAHLTDHGLAGDVDALAGST